MTDFEPPPNTPGRAEWVCTHISKLRARTALPPPERWSIGSWSWVPVEPLDIFAKSEALEATKPNDLKEFTLFSELPIELRKTIFEITIPDARTIEFSSYNVSIVNKESSYEDPNPSISYVTPMHDGHIDVTKRHPTTSSAEATTMNLPWVLLAVNSESRVVAQHFYTLSVEKRLGRGIYIDFKRDSLLFTSAHALQTMGGMMKPFKHSNWGQNRVDELIERLPTKRNEAEKYAQTIMLAGLLPKIKPLVVMLSRFQNLKEVHLVSERVRPGCICGHHAERINVEPFKKLWKELQDRDAEKTGILPSTRAFPDIVEWKEREFFREFTSKWIPERQGYSNDWKTFFASTDEEFERYLEALDLS
ncbi:uncharacterized protein PAC_11178 [Phialocephala subalpina]|uniref:2EXR domain-containing protein n=1 Tax=Phialocephala subalpina TaxID=576137 RepID=A0A1L7X8E6_9HELO|nr:uncharacterized protein PAC_11178 [Phialocephala subalpina]